MLLAKAKTGGQMGPGVEQKVSTEYELASGSGAWLLCAHCEHRITRDSERIEVDGSHLHTRLNPAAIPYHFGCFRTALGATSGGTPTTENTWFPRRAWQVAHCAGCGMHLGWFFTAPGEESFFGLILERLREEG